MSKWNLQLFGLEIDGIDEDILAELNAEQPQEEVTEEPQEVKEEAQEEVHGEADTDNKAVEQPLEDDEEEYASTGKVPYQRFKAVNEERKTSKARIKELEDEIASLRSNVATTDKVETPAQPIEEVQTDYNAEQSQRIYDLAYKRAMKRMNMSQEDLDALEYSDDTPKKMMFQYAVQDERQAVMAEIKAYQAKEAAFSQEIAETTKEFEAYNVKFGAYPDAQARWNYIAQERFNQLPKRKQDVINAAFARLQAKKGTYQDMDTVSAYFNSANKEWEAKSAPASAPVPSVNNNVDKVKKAQALPKAPQVNGGSGGDTVYTVERIATIMNSPDGWDSLPPEIQKQILEGRLK